jgi:hypothetical protein
MIKKAEIIVHLKKNEPFEPNFINEFSTVIEYVDWHSLEKPIEMINKKGIFMNEYSDQMKRTYSLSPDMSSRCVRVINIPPHYITFIEIRKKK